MEFLFFIGLLLALDVAALLWAHDSRDGFLTLRRH